ncbi:MAG: transglutaminase family protein [Chloroflexi bacterium]|nr:transglutaminase family protein [Chloroflexota bacterium]
MEPESAFARYVAGPEEEWNLAEAALLIAAEAYPALDVGRTLQWLEAQGQLLRQRLAPLSSPAQVIAAFNRLLFDELGFHGNAENYYDPRNSLLNDVIERRTGIPITLALVVMEIGARAGLTVEGVGLPGHFIVRVRGEGWQVLLDPFNRGAELSRYDCEQLMAQALGRPMPLLPHYLEPVAKRAFLMRMLNNLQAVYLQDRQWARVMATIANLFSLRPEPSAAAELYRVRGLVHYELGRLGAAEQDWLHYLTLAPDAPDERLIRDNIAAIRSEPARRN